MSDNIIAIRQSHGEWVTRDLIRSTLQSPFAWTEDGDGYVVHLGDSSVRVMLDTMAITFKDHNGTFTYSGATVRVLSALVKAQHDGWQQASDVERSIEEIIMRLQNLKENGDDGTP